jgi:hypothetical protein
VTRPLALLTAFSLLFAACGDDDDTATDDTAAETETDTEDSATDDTGTGSDAATDGGPYSTEDYAAVLAAELRTGGAFPGTEEQIGCVSEGFVEAIGGAEALNEAGLTPEELAEAQGPEDLGVELDEDAVADELVANFNDCDYDLIRLLAESLGPNAPEGFEDCVREELTNDDVAAVFARLIIDPNDRQAADAILPQLEACATTTTEG